MEFILTPLRVYPGAFFRLKEEKKKTCSYALNKAALGVFTVVRRNQ